MPDESRCGSKLGVKGGGQIGKDLVKPHQVPCATYYTAPLGIFVTVVQKRFRKMSFEPHLKDSN